MDDPPNSLLSKGSQTHRSTCSQAKLSSVIEGRPVVLAGVGACLGGGTSELSRTLGLFKILFRTQMQDFVKLNSKTRALDHM